MSIKKEVFQKMGYFDERFKVGGEDAEFCFRALKNGLAIYFKSDVIAYHYDRDSLTEFLKHQGNWTKEAIRIRRESGMDYAHLMPNSYIMAWLAILPLSILYTAFIVSRWLRYNPSVMLYTPAIFLGQLNRVSALKRFLKDK
jgi:GT2 family glycosyltransferase